MPITDFQTSTTFIPSTGPDYSLEISISGQGTVIADPSGPEYPLGTTVALVPQATEGWQFLRWEGDLTGLSVPGVLIMDSNKSVLAVFEEVVIDPTSSARVGIQHTYRGDLVVRIGAGSPSSPSWERTIHNRSGGGTNDLDLTVDLSDAAGFLPPSEEQRWFLEVRDQAGGDAGQIQIFEITHDGSTYRADLVPVPITDFQTSTTFIPSTGPDYSLEISISGQGTVIADPSGPEYPLGTTVALVPQATEGWQFLRWEGDLTGSSVPGVLTMDSSKSVLAVFVIVDTVVPTLRLAVEGEGTVIVDPPGPEYVLGSVVSLVPQATEGWQFLRWEGDLTGLSVPGVLIMDSNKSVLAVFEEVVIDPTSSARVGIQHTYRGDLVVRIGAGSPSSPSWERTIHNRSGGGTNDLDLTVDLSDAAGFLPPSEEQRWFLEVRDQAGGDAGQIQIFEITHDGSTYRADLVPVPITDFQTSTTFIPSTGPDYSLEISISGQGTVIADPSGPEYPLGTTVALVPQATEGWQFLRWEGDLTGSSVPGVLTMDSSKSVLAVFVIVDTVVPTLRLAVEGEGTVIVDPPGPEYVLGSVVSLVPQATEGWQFLRWEGDLTGLSVPGVLIMDSNKSVLAVFEEVVIDPTSSARVGIQHTYRGDLVVRIGAGTPSSPSWERTIHNRSGGGTNDLDLTVDLSDAAAFLPPGEEQRWFLEVRDQAGGDAGQIEVFQIAHDGSTYQANLVRVPITDFQTSTTFIPSSVTSNATLEIVVRGEGTVVADPPGPEYSLGTTVALIPRAAEGWEFLQWAGDLGGSSVPGVLTMDSSKSVLAVFVIVDTVVPTLRLAVEGEGTVIADPPGPEYSLGTTVALIPRAAEGWEFLQWTGDLGGSSVPGVLTMDSSKSVLAVFVIGPEVIESTSSARVGIQHTYRGDLVVRIGAGTPSSPSWERTIHNRSGGSANDLDLTVDLSDAAAFLPPGEAQSWFLEVRDQAGGDAGQIEVFQITHDGSTYQANLVPVPITDFQTSTTFIPSSVTSNATLEIVVRGEGTVIADPPGPEYSLGTTVALIPRAAEGWEFLQWTGDLGGSSVPGVLTMDSSKSVLAVFVIVDTVVPTLRLAVEGEGTVIADPPGPEYSLGTTVALIPRAAEGWEFLQWAGDLGGSSVPGVLTMDSSKSVLAVFVIVDTVVPTLRLAVEGEGTVVADPPGPEYSLGTTVALVPQATEGWQFSRWEGDLTGSSVPGVLTMDSSKSVLAVFVIVDTVVTTLEMVVSGQGTVITDPSGPEYPLGTTVALIPRAAAGWEFSYWLGDLSGAAVPGVLTMTEDKSVLAVFEDTITSEATWVGSDVNGEPSSLSYRGGSSDVLIATLDGSSIVDTVIFTVTGPNGYSQSAAGNSCGVADHSEDVPAYIARCWDAFVSLPANTSTSD